MTRLRDDRGLLGRSGRARTCATLPVGARACALVVSRHRPFWLTRSPTIEVVPRPWSRVLVRLTPPTRTPMRVVQVSLATRLPTRHLPTVDTSRGQA